MTADNPAPYVTNHKAVTCGQMGTRWRQDAACATHDPALFFPDLDGPDNHGRQATAICATCPVRTDCLTDAVATREKWGIRAGAGELQRRALRRAYIQDGPTGPVWQLALTRHFTRLDGTRTGPVNGNGNHATHGKPSSYAKGCRCVPCTLSASWRGAAAKITGPTRKRTAA